jgi:hypothetical protein
VPKEVVPEEVVPDDPRWPGVLDALEADAVRLGSDAPAGIGVLYVPPIDLGTLPLSLRARAEEVVVALGSSAVALQEQLDSVRSELTRVERSQRVGVITPERRGGFEVMA